MNHYNVNNWAKLISVMVLILLAGAWMSAEFSIGLGIAAVIALTIAAFVMMIGTKR